MPKDKETKSLQEGYQPTKGVLDTSNPPKGGSGVSSNSSSEVSSTSSDSKKD